MLILLLPAENYISTSISHKYQKGVLFILRNNFSQNVNNIMICDIVMVCILELIFICYFENYSHAL